MRDLVYKEFKLAIHPFYLILPIITGALMLIPQWLYFLVPLYFCFIAVPNLFSTFRSGNDLQFSMILPVSREQIVRAKIISFVILELVHIAWAVLFAWVHHLLYHMPNFAYDQNAGFFGWVFLMFGFYNLILFPLHYRSGYAFGLPVILSTVFGVLFTAGIEFLVLFSPAFRAFAEQDQGASIMMLVTGIISFLLLTLVSVRLSQRNFKSVDV